MYKPKRVELDNVCLKFFPSSLSGEARKWFDKQPTGIFRNWDELGKTFLTDFFPMSITKKFIDQIMTFKQREGEEFHKAYERYQDYLDDCPHHGFNRSQVMRYFYYGMNKEARERMDTTSGGAIMEMTAKQGLELVGKIAMNARRYYNEESSNWFVANEGRHKEESQHVSKGDLETILRKIEDLACIVEINKPKKENYDTRTCLICYSEKHPTKSCPLMEKEEESRVEEVRLIKSKVNPPSYYRGNQNSVYEEGVQPRERYSLSEHNIDSHQEETSCHDRFTPYTQEPRPSQISSQPSQETLIALMADLVKRSSDDIKDFVTREIGSLKVEKDEIKDQVKAMAITLKSGKTLDPPKWPAGLVEPRQEEEEEIEVRVEVTKEPEVDKIKKRTQEVELRLRVHIEEDRQPPPYVPKISFPQRVKKSKLDKQFQHFSEMINKLYVTLPFSEVITQNPVYIKFLKDIMSNRRELEK